MLSMHDQLNYKTIELFNMEINFIPLVYDLVHSIITLYCKMTLRKDI